MSISFPFVPHPGGGCFEYFERHRTVDHAEPVITDRQGFWGVDTTFPGFVLVYPLQEEEPAIPAAEFDERITADLAALIARHPGRRVGLVEWVANEDLLPRFCGLCRRRNVRSATRPIQL